MTARKMMRRSLVAAAIAGGMALAAAVPAAAGTPSAVLKNTAAKRVDGPYQDNTPAISANLAVDEKKNFYVKVKNISDEAQDPVRFFNNSMITPDWKVKWFKGTKNVSAEVNGPGTFFKLPAGKAKIFRVRVIAAEGFQCIGAESRDEEDNNAFVRISINGACPG